MGALNASLQHHTPWACVHTEPWKLEDSYGFSVPTRAGCVRWLAWGACILLLSLPLEIDVYKPHRETPWRRLIYYFQHAASTRVRAHVHRDSTRWSTKKITLVDLVQPIASSRMRRNFTVPEPQIFIDVHRRDLRRCVGSNEKLRYTQKYNVAVRGGSRGGTINRFCEMNLSRVNYRVGTSLRMADILSPF